MPGVSVQVLAERLRELDHTPPVMVDLVAWVISLDLAGSTRNLLFTLAFNRMCRIKP